MKSFAGRELGLWLAALLQFILQGLILRTLTHLAHGEIIDPPQHVFFVHVFD